MDALVTAVLQATPSLGVGGLLITYIVILIRREARVDESHGVALTRQQDRHVTELERLNRDHDAELFEHRETIRDLRREVNELYDHLAAIRAERLGLTTRTLNRTLDEGGSS